MNWDWPRSVHRSSFIVHRSFLALLLLLAACARETPKYNVVLITLDTFRADRATTPNLSRLAAQGVRFEQAQSPVPLTLPAHASILSGLLPLHHGLRNNGAGTFPADRETLATTLSRNGYRTAAFVGAFVLDHRFGLDRGFDTYDDEIPRDSSGDVSLEAARRADAVVDRAVAWLGGASEQPSFAWVHLWDAHAPYAPPAPHPQTYDGEVAYVDQQLGRLLSAIDTKNTIVIVVGDHGEGLGEHGEGTHGLLLYQSTLHVPMLIAAPDVEPRVVREPVSSVDLAPTVAALLEIEFPKVDGRNVLAESLPSVDLYAETQYPLTFGWNELASLRNRNTKVISAPYPELYDLAGDPREIRNVISNERRTARELLPRLTAIRQTAVVPAAVRVDEETRRKLESLGYVSPQPVQGRATRPDPKAMVALFTEFERGRTSIPVLENLVRRDPYNPVFRSALARLQRDGGQNESAVDLLRGTVALAPADADAWYNLGVALTEANELDEALAALTESARLDPLRAATQNAIGVILIQRGDAQAAANAFRRATELDPRDARGWNNAGNALRALANVGDAATAYRKAIELSPNYADPHNGLGVILVQSRRPAEAVRSFETAIRLQPDFHKARLNLGIALQESGRVQEAAAQYEALLKSAAPEEQRAAARTLLAGIRSR
ncbi:MAG TPA: sulfatase-like hydrolase/transferase [Thermoanaerobaculia bacterium]|jgi:arylsulfatase A-like enzyme/Flp pilus assembly protein TadD